MSNDPDSIRAQIEATRAGLSVDVNELGDKVSPAQIAKRQRDKVSGALVGVKDHIMGATDSASSSVGQTVSDTSDKVARKAQGSPLAVGLIAFGAGLLLSALVPASRPEAQAAAALKEQAQPLVEQLTAAGKEAAGNLQEPAQQALESVKSTAGDAVDTVKDQGASAVDDVKTQAADAKDTVQQHASSS